MDERDIKSLKERYLIWLYKATKEALDKVERKFTQLEIDRFILKELKGARQDKELQKFIHDFEAHIENKEKEGLSLKYDNKELKPDYLFLALKLKAIEKAIARELGKAALGKIKGFYESEMTERILKAIEHK